LIVFKILCKDFRQTRDQSYKGLRPLQYSPSDYLLIINTFDANNKAKFSKTIKGDDIPEFFTDGNVIIKFEQPFVLRRKPGTESFESDFENFRSKTDRHFTIEAHIVRLPDGKGIMLTKNAYSDAYYGNSEYITLQCANDHYQNPTNVYLNLTNVYGRGLMASLSDEDNIVTNLAIISTLICREASVRASESNPLGANTVEAFELEITGLRNVHRVHANQFQFFADSLSECLRPETFSFAHILEALDDWLAE